jgi:replication initiation and membrane attachment protein DnaB
MQSSLINHYFSGAKILFFTLILTFLGQVNQVFSQSDAEKVLDAASLTTIAPKDFQMNLLGQIMLKFDYGKATLSNFEDVTLMKYIDIYKIDLVYTWHSSGKTEIRQKPLNIQRLAELEKLFPNLLKSKKIKWQLVVQTDENVMHEKDLFHGFVVHYKLPKQ